MSDDERKVLLEQVSELLEGEIVDDDDALEIAIVAGLAARLGGDDPVLVLARAWRDGDGKELLDEAFADLELDEVVDAIDGVLTHEATEEEVEEALYEFDDLAAAAIWCGRAKAVRAAARRVSDAIRQVPEPFIPLADYGIMMAKTAAVAADYDIYDYWMAVADAAKWK